MTPDLRFTVRNAGPLDLRLRVARNGDTCVENRGPGAPTLAVSDPFGESMYEVAPDQHVLFEHGSLHEVVDNETTPCGCPGRERHVPGRRAARSAQHDVRAQDLRRLRRPHRRRLRLLRRLWSPAPPPAPVVVA